MLQPQQMKLVNSSETTAVPKKCLYLLYQPFGISKYFAYLYKMDIDLTTKTTTAPQDLSPVLEIENRGHAIGMRGVRLGFKFYFLGGTVKHDDRNDEFPRDVYVLDMLTDSFKKMDVLLNAGKPDSCVVFAVNGKLYALGRIPTIPSEELSSLKLFECFDPTTGKWQVLDNLSPVGTEQCWFRGSSPRGVNWEGCTVLRKRQQVVLLGWERSMYYDSHFVVFVYHLQKNKWTRHIPLSSTYVLSIVEGHDNNYLYGLPCYSGPPLKLKSGCDEMSLFGNDELTQMLIPNTPTLVEEKCVEFMVDYFGLPYLWPADRLLCYLGNDHFCYIASGRPRSPDSPDFDDEELAIPDTQGITITLFKEKKENYVSKLRFCVLNNMLLRIQITTDLHNWSNASSLTLIWNAASLKRQSLHLTIVLLFSHHHGSTYPLLEDKNGERRMGTKLCRRRWRRLESISSRLLQLDSRPLRCLRTLEISSIKVSSNSEKRHQI